MQESFDFTICNPSPNTKTLSNARRNLLGGCAPASAPQFVHRIWMDLKLLKDVLAGLRNELCPLVRAFTFVSMHCERKNGATWDRNIKTVWLSNADFTFTKLYNPSCKNQLVAGVVESRENNLLTGSLWGRDGFPECNQGKLMFAQGFGLLRQVLHGFR